jgi:integrase
MKLKLTDGKGGSIHRRAPVGEVLWDTLLGGFGVIIGKKANVYFVKTRVKGQPGQPTCRLGKVGMIDLPAARKAARQIIEDAQAGLHPGKAAKDAEAARAAAERAAAEVDASTFYNVATDYLADKLEGGGAHLKSRSELERKLKVDLADWHNRPIREITKAEIRAVVRTKAQDHGAAANRLLSFIKRVFAWAEDQELIDANVARSVGKAAKESKRDRSLDDREIRLFWKACDRLGDPAGRLFKLCLVTGQRRGEVAGLRRTELGKLSYPTKDPRSGKKVMVQADAWNIPRERTKRLHAHSVPLSKLAHSLIDGAPVLVDEEGKAFDHIFPSGRRGDQPVSGWSRYRSQLDREIGHLIAEEVSEEYDAARHTIPDWHIHDLRATAATRLEIEPIAAPLRVISRILNHAEGDGTGSTKSQTARYARHTFDKEGAEALQSWADELERIVGLNVKPLKKQHA